MAWALALILSACAPSGEFADTTAVVEPPTITSPNDQAEMLDAAPDPCGEWDVESLEWRALVDPTERTIEDSVGNQVTLLTTSLPPSSSERYNVGVEVCQGILLVIDPAGESRFISLDEWSWATGPDFAPSGETGQVSGAGVSSGGPTWGFRDGLIAENTLFLSDAVVDTTKECVRVDVHRVPLAGILQGTPESTVILESTPCVSYTDARRQASAIRTHLGSALAFNPETKNLYLSIGDFHLGASTIAQAAGIGLKGTILDYEIMTNPSAMVSAVVEITEPFTSPSASVYAKGLRNSLGMAFDEQGTLWLSDHGPQGGDELNAIEKAGNYGWPLTSPGRPYDRAAWPRSSADLIAPWLDFQNVDIEGAIDPALSWTPAIAPTEMAVYPADGPITYYRGKMLMASLRAEALFVLNLNDLPTTESSLTLGSRQRNMTLTSEGEIVLLTDSKELMVLRVSV